MLSSITSAIKPLTAPRAEAMTISIAPPHDSQGTGCGTERPPRGVLYVARWDRYPKARDPASRSRNLRGSVSGANRARSGKAGRANVIAMDMPTVDTPFVARMKQRLSTVSRESYPRSSRSSCFHKFYYDEPGAETGDNANRVGINGEPLRNHRYGKYKNNDNRARYNDVDRINLEVCLARAPVLFSLLSTSKRYQIVVVFTVWHRFHLGTRDVEHGSIVFNTV
jgi:hypothetical protein